MGIWCLAVKHDMTPEGKPFQVDYDDNDSVATLKEKVKKEMEPKLNDFDANSFTVWQCKEPKLLADVNANKLEDVDLSDRRKAVRLASVETVASLKLSKNEILLVQMPGKCPHSSYNFTILIYQWTLARSSEDGEAATNIQKHEIYKGLEDSIIIINEDDDDFDHPILSDNKVYEMAGNVTNVDYLTRFQENLQKKRPVHPDVGVSLGPSLIGYWISFKFKDNLAQKLGKDFATLYDPAVLDNCCKTEMVHMLAITLEDVDMLLGGGWKEFEVYALFFQLFTQYCVGYFENLDHVFESGL